MIRAVHHLSFSTRDVERLLGFYRDLRWTSRRPST
jgi:hypothetical protein